MRQNISGKWVRAPSAWRKIALNTWSEPDNPSVHCLIEVDAGRVVEFLERRSAESGVKCTMTHAVTRAVAMTLARYPEANVCVRGRRIWQRDDVDVFLQVAMPAGESTAKADLSGAVIRRADRLRVEDVARQLRDKAAAVREKRDGDMAKTRGLLFSLPGPAVKLGLALIDLVQYGLNVSLPGVPRDPFGSVMVSSVGMLGINLAFAPIVTFSHCPSVVLVGQIEDRPVVRDGRVAVRPMCSITATFDHRVFDGFQGGRMVTMLRTCLEAPDLLDRDPLAPDLP